MAVKYDQNWTLFLDRDGVINRRIPGAYVSRWSEFDWLEGSGDAIVQLSQLFGITVVVTNQQGVGKRLVRRSTLEKIHARMQQQVASKGGRIDKVYYCPTLASKNPECRKPRTGMAEQAKIDFPLIDFNRSVMVGDSISDMQFGQAMGMQTIWIEGKEEEQEEVQQLEVDMQFESLAAFASWVVTNQE